MKRIITLSCVLAIWLDARAALANPVIGPEYYIFSAYWFLKTLPFNYAADFIALSIALSIALLVTGQIQRATWRLLPLYSLPVLVAGYAADAAGAGVARYHVVGMPANEPLVGAMVNPLGLSQTMYDYPTRMGESAAMLGSATVLIFGANCLILAAILRWNEADSYRRVPLAAAIIAVLTAPYFGVARTAWPTRLVPLAIVLGGAGLWWSGKVLLRAWRDSASARRTGGSALSDLRNS